MFLHGGVIINQVFFYAVVDKAFSTFDVVLVAAVAREYISLARNIFSYP